MKKTHRLSISLVLAFLIVFCTPSIASATVVSEPIQSRVSDKTSMTFAPVDAEDDKNKGKQNGVSDNEKELFDQQGGDPRVTNYWTEERMANAIPADIESSVSTIISRGNVSRGISEVAPRITLSDPVESVFPSNGIAPRTVTYWSKTNGKVYYQDQTNGLNYVCSGSALNSASKRLVLTAGHCVHGGKTGTWHAKWEFVPDYSNGSRPYGTFQAYSLRTYNDWINYGDSYNNDSYVDATGQGWNSDVAMVTTYNNSAGTPVVNAVGGHGITYGTIDDFYADIFGYPGNLDNGQYMYACSGTPLITEMRYGLFYRISGCNFGGGASGGPWLENYSNSTGLGYARTVTSHEPGDGSHTYIEGANFDSRIAGLFENANNDW